MDNEDYYQTRIKEIFNNAAATEKRWIAKDAANATLAAEKQSMEIGSGGYRSMGWKQGDERFSWGTCYRCSAQMKNERICAGCRHNGDGYGSDVSHCTTCGFFCWDSYDEA